MKQKLGSGTTAVQTGQMITTWVYAILTDKTARWAIFFTIVCLIRSAGWKPAQCQQDAGAPFTEEHEK